MSSLLSVRDLTIDFLHEQRWNRVVDQLSFDIQPGESLGIVGESGSGKTVTCRSLIQLLPIHRTRISGSVDFGGQNLLELSNERLTRVRGEKIAMIFQNPSSHLDPLMKIGDQISEAVIQHRGISRDSARQQVVEVLSQVGIANPKSNYDAYPHQFSGGMRQRVMIAAALVCEPSLLIADEPTTALDVTVQAMVLDLLDDLRQERNLSILLVSHDLGVIAERCDRVLVMYRGKLIESAQTQRLVSTPQHPYTRQLIQSQPNMVTPGKPFPVFDDELPATPNRMSKTYNGVDEGRTKTLPAIEQKKILLEVKSLHVHFQRPTNLLKLLLRRMTDPVTAVDGVDLTVFRGDSVGIVGESGSGKSTLARTLVNIVKPDHGQIIFNGADLALFDPAQRINHCRQVQMVFQDPVLSLNPRMSIQATLSEALLAHNMCESHEITERIDALMTRVGLPIELAERKPHQLSGGQCQRVGIARALSVEPQLIIADEATSALDVTIQAQILNLLMQLCKDLQVTLLFISHDLGVIRHLCQTVAVMKNGRIVESGTVEQVFNSPKNTYTEKLIQSIPALG